MTCVSQLRDPGTDTFRHEAAFYRGTDQMLAGVLPFVREGLALGEAVLVAMPADRIDALRQALGAQAARATFVDMLEIGSNPARIIPEWRRFLANAEGVPVRGVSEPVWAGRRDVEIDECALHESLLNLAFDDGPGWRLMCPYDVEGLPADVVEEALRTHPMVGPTTPRDIAYEGHDLAFTAFAEPLREHPADADRIRFGPDDLTGVRDLVRWLSQRGGLAMGAAEDVVLAVHELASNSIHHGGGQGVLSTWDEPGAFVVEVSDSGTIANPLVGRELSSPVAEGGRGLWMANQLCDLVQVRSSSTGTVVRLFSWL